ncbi:NF038122 family metalloprotease [Novosphingobium sp.]|uniref:NF038122 family metalloprotease n=1 Tax=Novosphingobium sp. TaxID=1874826 RepID=UPI003D0E3EA4
MIINVTYDASAANAPAGFEQAVQAAVQYWENQISTPITVNIDFGWGEVDGQAISAGALGESSTGVTIALPRQLTALGSNTPGGSVANAAYRRLVDSFGLSGPGSISQNNDALSTDFVMTIAQARVLGSFDDGTPVPADAIDGYVGLDSTQTYTFDPNNRAVSDAYDAIGIIEHEISEVLGRIDGLGQEISGYANVDTMLDFFRYSSNGQVTLQLGDGSLSLDGGRNDLLPFDNPDNGGDAGDWSTAVTGDAFDAFASPGEALLVSPVDLIEMQALGYKLATPQDVIGQTDVTSEAGLSPNGTITRSGGTETVTAVATGADAVALFSNAITGTPLDFDNTGTIHVVSQTANAWGAWGGEYDFTFDNEASATLTVTAADQAMGAFLNSDGAFTNAGSMTITGQTAYGETGAIALDNSGTLTVVATGAGQASVAFDIINPWDATLVNSGTITADYAVLVDENPGVITLFTSQTPLGLVTVTINNSGTINGITSLTDVMGRITNTGLITGAIRFGNFDSTYMGANGRDTGGIYLGSGTNTVALGNDGEAVFGGGYADTITGGTGNDFIEIDDGTNTIDGGGGVNILSFADADGGVSVDLGAGTATAGGRDTLKNIQEVIGSGFNDTLKAGSTATVLVGGSGDDPLTGGEGNDTLVAGTGVATITGGGGNNTFVVTKGGKSVIITDFDASGDQDVLDIYGTAAAPSVVQQGADTLITLATGDTVLLKNVQASSLAAGNLVTNAGQFTTEPSEPASPPVFGTKPITFTHDLTIAQGEVLNEADVPVALTDSSYAPVDQRFHSFDNQGTVNVSTDTGNVIGLQTDLSSDIFTTQTFDNEAGAVFSVSDTSADGTAYGFYTGYYPPITNAGTVAVNANGDAYGLWLLEGTGSTVTNTVTGVIISQSSGGKADGVYFDGDGDFTNNGRISATGFSAAYGVDFHQAAQSTFVNKGSILASATGAGAVSYGVYVLTDANFPMTITNSGAITAQVAIALFSEFARSVLTLTNSGMITGKVDLGDGGGQGSASAEWVSNTGRIVGNIVMNNGTDNFNGAGGTLAGDLYLGAGTDTVTLGNDGENVFGGGGNDTITGGAGNDFIEIGRGHASIDGGGGFNTLSFADADEGVTVNLGMGTGTGAGSFTIRNIQEVIGSQYDDTLIAGAAAATLIAGSGEDTLTGGAGNDTLVAGAGGDVMTGGGGNNTFVYASGDHQLVITDFDANGDADMLQIYGYRAAQSIVQQGANTLITLSATDSIVLHNTLAASLPGSALHFSADAWQAPAVPKSPPVYFSSTSPFIYYYNLLIYAGETLNIVSHTGDLNINQNFALSCRNDSEFTNYGIVSITSADDMLSGMSDGSDVFVDGLAWNNEAGARITITDTGGSVTTGVSVGGAGATITNAGQITVTALTSASGLSTGTFTASVDNTATGMMSVTSQSADATALEDYSATPITNEGLISASGVTAAVGISWLVQTQSPITNSGTITASASGAGSVSYGILAYGAYNEDYPEKIVNNGTITAEIAIGNITLSGDQGFAPLTITNNAGATINGALDMEGSDSSIANSGAINGDIVFATVEYELTQPTLFGIYPPTVTNSGTITGNIVLADNDSSVTNTGRIIGNISVGDAAFRYLGASGSLTGSITIGDGDSTTNTGSSITASNSAVVLNGAQASVTGGSDTIDFSPGTTGDAVVLGGTASAWNTVSGSGGTIDLSDAQAAIKGGNNTIGFTGAAGSVVGLYATGSNWDSVSGPVAGTIYLTGAQAAIAGGGDVVSFAGGSGNVVGLYDTGGSWDSVWAPGSETIYLTSAQAAITGGGDTISFAGGAGNVVGLYDTGGAWDSVWAPGSETIYLTSAQAAISGGGDTISFAGGSGNVVGLYDTGGAWDSVWAPGGETIYLTSAQAAITGGGDAISFAGGTGNVVGLYNTGGTADTVWAPGGATIYFTSAQATVTGGGDAISFAGGIGNAATLQNTGATADTVYATGGTISLNNAKAAFTGTGDIVNFSGSSAATFAGANQTLAFAPRIGGNDVITGFASSDSVQFSASDFNSWAALLGATTQSGSDTLITLNASDTVRLVGVTASSLTASQFHFV